MTTSGQLLQQVQFLDKYSRQTGTGRETWEQAVDRVMDYLVDLSENKLPPNDYDFIRRMIQEQKAMPSMRALAMAGAAAKRQSACIYNCAYAPIVDLDVFREAVIILMSGAGLGYSVEEKYISQLPDVLPQSGDGISFQVPDTTEGWAEAIHLGIVSWIFGVDVTFDVSKIRPEGTPLKTKGGIASGPKHLEDALSRIKQIILARQGGRLRSIDCHDIMCFIAEAIVSGGVRRSAMICLFDENDQLMRTCKDGDQLVGNEQRWNANNSLVISQSSPREWWLSFIKEMSDSGRGEPGFFSRHAIQRNSRRDPYPYTSSDWGTNPCAEIVLKPFQFCNLSSAVCRHDDTLETLLEKVRAATIIGTIQSMANHFPGLRPEWSQNNIEDRLLGVDLMGIMDCPVVRNLGVLNTLRLEAEFENERVAWLLGINKAAAITCVKPSGNSSVLLDASPGIHARWSDYYIRRVTFVERSPIRMELDRQGVPMERKNGTANQWVVSFPIASPPGAIVVGQRTAREQLETWLTLKLAWTHHNPSCTITYRPHELDDIAEWLYQFQSELGGLSFLPYFDAQYEQMPYEAISEEKYHQLAAAFPESVDMSHIVGAVNVAATPACDSDVCELPQRR